MLEVRLLGQFDVRQDHTPFVISTRAAQSLFAYLLLTVGTLHRREKLAGLLWPETTDANARKNLRTELWRLRQAIGIKSTRKKTIPYFLVDEISIGFNPESPHWLDASSVLAPLTKQTSTGNLIETLLHYRGELLPGLYDDWVVLERERVRAAFEQKTTRLLEILVEEKRWEDILEWGERWISFGQTPEPAYRALMLAYDARGDKAKVALTYQRCATALHNDLGVDPSAETQVLFERLSKSEHSITPTEIIPAETKSPLSPQSTRVFNLPVPPTSFIGRAKELKEIEGLLSSSRLLTLTGSGGVGKTRLAIQVAHDSVAKFNDGVFWVDLVGLSNPNLIPQEIAQSLHVREAPNAPLIETLKNDLAAKNLLVVLDNCEHLIESAAQTAEQLLSGCPQLRILATSRERLGIFNETVWRVPSLSEKTSRKLFVERARVAQHDFALTSLNESFVAQICARLDGIPLAIELAAVRTAMLTVEEIARRLGDRFGLLTSGSRTALPRHQTLRATIDWSYDLLTEPERILFRRLAVFSGGFTLDAAEAVCSQGELKRNDILDALGRLVDKSLVIVEQESVLDETRYRLLETIRQYALEKLEEKGEAAAIRDRHLGYYLTLAENSEPNILGIESAAWSRRLDKELDNIRVAIEWSTNTGHADAALRILGSLVYFWFAHRPAAFEWHDWLQQALARPEARERTLARAKALNGVGFMNWADFDPTDIRPELEEALSIGREFGDPWNTATALHYLGVLENIEGHYLEARAYLEQSLLIWREMGLNGQLGRAWTLNFLGDVALNRGEAELARSLYEEAVTILRETGEFNFLAYAVRRLAQHQWREDNHEKAIALCKESLNLNQQVDSPRGVIACLAGFAAIAVAMDRYEDAAQLMAAVETQVASLGVRLVYMDRLEYERNLALLRTKLDEKTLSKLWAQGKAMTMEQAVASALMLANSGVP